MRDWQSLSKTASAPPRSRTASSDRTRTSGPGWPKGPTPSARPAPRNDDYLQRAAEDPSPCRRGRARSAWSLVTAEESRDTAALLPHGRLVTVPGAGHLPPLETPVAVTRELTTSSS
ncbi:alpha/beta hydrolase [Streptomyces sp. DG2A-72]|uniref:alpha/beta fold hydrolase n=1 Tax=Streptomyces sp. DG2A-72 TaxID=3051386 RepID=UPI00265C7A53|nr:alpha/beta hydrolase [Streptomyces sp. DG2A-72]MDO0939386.1 alpha/beta hydrolase [Streptomyces sp. DG2A-72]